MIKEFVNYIKESKTDHYTEKERDILLHNGFRLYNKMEAHKQEDNMHASIMKICLSGNLNVTFYQYSVNKREKGVSKLYGSGSEKDLLTAINKVQKNFDKQKMSYYKPDKIAYIDKATSKSVENIYFSLQNENKNIIIKYDDFVNEGIYNWMVSRASTDKMSAIVFIFLVSASIQFCQFMDMSMIGRYILLLLLLMGTIPFVLVTYRAIFRQLYHSIRKKTFLKQTDKKYKKILDMIGKYPDMKEELREIKVDMIEGIREENRNKVSDCIHRIYVLSKNLKRREKLPNMAVAEPVEVGRNK
jgi:hypothetical protein